jgi:hypothetical protein
MRSLAHAIALVIHLIASASFAGGCFYGARIEGPCLRGCAPEEFGSLMRALLPHAGVWMFPPLVVATLASLPLTASATSAWGPVTTLFVAILAITFVVHIPLNVELMRGPLSPARLDAIRSRWLLWHDYRAALAVLALAWAVVMTVARSIPSSPSTPH